ncbi:hypothetical protein ALP94_01925 [Pseudomonas savastanoi pv. glycinea]|nr:hypothetical protein ALP94_01925 [Pseudomonas savastanoi pv. glycinea]
MISIPVGVAQGCEAFPVKYSLRSLRQHPQVNFLLPDSTASEA